MTVNESPAPVLRVTHISSLEVALTSIGVLAKALLTIRLLSIGLLSIRLPISLLTIWLLAIWLLTISLLLSTIHMLVLRHVFDSTEQFDLVSPTISIAIDSSHCLERLHLINAHGPSETAEDLVEEVAQFIRIQCSAAIPIEHHEHLIDVHPQLLVGNCVHAD